MNVAALLCLTEQFDDRKQAAAATLEHIQSGQALTHLNKSNKRRRTYHV